MFGVVRILILVDTHVMQNKLFLQLVLVSLELVHLGGVDLRQDIGIGVLAMLLSGLYILCNLRLNLIFYRIEQVIPRQFLVQVIASEYFVVFFLVVCDPGQVFSQLGRVLGDLPRNLDVSCFLSVLKDCKVHFYLLI